MQKIKHFFSQVRIGTSGAIIIGACILAASHLGYGYLMSQGGTQAKVSLFKGRAVDASDLVTGKEKSKFFLVEYSDTECPYCAQLHPTIKRLHEEYGDRIGFVYRYFPLTQIHQQAFDEAKAIHCVGSSLGAIKRWEYIDTLFTQKSTNKNMSLPRGVKESIAKNLGVNEQSFASCMQSQEATDAVSTSIQDGIAAGVQGTPASFILKKTKNGYEVVAMVDGARPYDYFKPILDDLLK